MGPYGVEVQLMVTNKSYARGKLWSAAVLQKSLCLYEDSTLQGTMIEYCEKSLGVCGDSFARGEARTMRVLAVSCEADDR